MDSPKHPAYRYNVPPDMSYLEEWFKPEVRETYKVLNKPLGDFPWKDDDITICTFPRSGTHLYWHAVRMVLQKKAIIADDPMEDSMLTMFTFKDTPRPSPRVWSTHSLPCDFTDDVILNGHRKFIYVRRNPKDVLVSYGFLTSEFSKNLNKIPSFEEYVNVFASNALLPSCRSWFDHVRAWAEYTDFHPEAPIHAVSYEDFAKDGAGEIRKLATFLEVDLSEEIIESIAEKLLFKNLKIAPISDELEETCNFGKPTLYRKGLVGGWKDAFTVAQSELFDRQFVKHMSGFKWQITYE